MPAFEQLAPTRRQGQAQDRFETIGSDWRLTPAMSQIRTGQPVKSIAAELGYASASSLSKAFKQRFGVSPRGWNVGG